jgi:hypothetical protein
MTVLYVVVGYCALYAVIWLHEVGHSVVYANYECKDNPFKVHVPVYLFFSTPRPVNVERARHLTPKQSFHVGVGGIFVNFLFGIPLAALFLITKYDPSLFMFFFYTFALFHLVEAATYLTISNVFLASDMISVQNYKPTYRIPFFVIGLATVAVIVMMIVNAPEAWKVGYIISICIMTLCMGLGRTIFSRRAQAL